MQEINNGQDQEVDGVNTPFSAKKESREKEMTAAGDQEMLIAKLRLAEERSAVLATIVDSSDDAIIGKDLNGFVTSWNLAAERIFGYSAEEMVKQSVSKLIPENRQDEETLILNKIRKGECVKYFHTRRLTKSGRLIDVSLTISPVKNEKGVIIGVTKIARDITDKKQEEQRKNDFIAIVSHELRTPLTSMRSYVQLALAKAVKGADVFTENVLTRAENQTRKMTTLIQDFLNLSRLEEGKMSLLLSEFSLRELMEEVMSDALALSSTHQIQYESCPEVTITADREKLGQVLTNVIGNAIKYSPEGTGIIVQCRVNNERIEFSVTDEGYGISAADQTRLFERFYRAENIRQNNVSGFGIGLYLVAEILKLHGGEITVCSEPEKGATFTFYLPFLGDK